MTSHSFRHFLTPLSPLSYALPSQFVLPDSPSFHEVIYVTPCHFQYWERYLHRSLLATTNRANLAPEVSIT